jgi:V/A-type H+-transporting ATPase subunit C
VPKHAYPTLLQLYRYYEVDNLKAILRGIVTGASWDRVRYVLFPFGTAAVFQAQPLLEAGNVDNAVELLKQTPYYDSLLFAMKRYREEKSLFPLEIALDLSYWRDLWQTINKLPSEDKTQAIRIIGALVDITNMMWAIRYREYYRLSEEELINYTLPFGYHSTQKDIRDIAAGAEISQVLRRVFPDLPEADAQLSSDRHRLPELEQKLRQHLVRQYRAVFLGNPFHIGISMAYLLLCEFEIRDLTILVEAKSSLVQAEEYQPYLLTLN